MPANTIYIVKGDTNPSITFTIKDSAGVAVNLTGMTIRFKIREQIGTVNTNNSSNTCTLTNPTAGICKYTFGATDFTTTGDYLGQLVLQFTDSTIHAVPTFINLQVIEQF